MDETPMTNLHGGPFLPTTIERTAGGERSLDPYSQLFKERIVLLDSPIDHSVSSAIIAQLLWLNKQSAEPIFMYINSPGGSVTDGLAIYDVMNHIKPEVNTVVVGMAASMGAFLLSSGAKGKRFALPNATIMIHQPRVMGQGIDGVVTDIEIVTKHLNQNKTRLAQILANNTGKTLKTIIRDTERDNFMDAHEAVAYGLIDEVIS